MPKVIEHRAATGYLTTAQVADLLGVHKNTVGLWRRTGRGPTYQCVGDSQRPRIRYRAADVHKWMRTHNVDPEQMTA